MNPAEKAARKLLDAWTPKIEANLRQRIAREMELAAPTHRSRI